MLTSKPQKTPKIYACFFCDYISHNKKDFNRHIVTEKHNANKMLTHANIKNPLLCSCGKSYKHRSSLTRHKKSCLAIMKMDENGEKTATVNFYENENENKVELLEKQVESMTGLIKELIKKVGTQNTIIGHNNNMNINKNEIKIYLSENCAGALSIQDFMRQLAITLDDLNAARDNTVMGITHIVEKNLKPLSFKERPMHCLKENEWYVKDQQEGWNEDDGEKIVNETHKNIQKHCLDKLCSEDTETMNTTDVHMSDNMISLISFGTGDLRETEKQELKRNLSGFCVLK